MGLIWCLVPRSVIYLPREYLERSLPTNESPSEARTAAWGALLPASTTTPHAQASWSLSFFSKSNEEPSLPQCFLCCLCREPASADWCCPQQLVCPGGFAIPGSSGTRVILWLQPPSQAARGCAQQAAHETGGSGSLYLLAWHPSCCWAGESQRCPCAEAAVPGKPGSQMAAVAPPHPGIGGWGFPAAVGQSSPRAQECCQLLQPLQQVSAEGLNMEPDVRQDWLCPVGR